MKATDLNKLPDRDLQAAVEVLTSVPAQQANNFGYR